MRLRPGDVRWDSGAVFVAGRRKGQGTKGQTLPLTSQGLAALQQFDELDCWSRASGPNRCRCSTTPQRNQASTARRGVPAGRARCVRAPPARCARRAWRQTSAPPRPGRWRVLRHGAPGTHTRVGEVLTLRHSRSVIGAVAVAPGGRSLVYAFSTPPEPAGDPASRGALKLRRLLSTRKWTCLGGGVASNL